MLKELAVPEKLLGYNYLLTAVVMVAQDDSLLQAITKELYPEVAKVHRTTPSKAERAIRHAVEVAFNRGDYNMLDKCFGSTISREKGKTTNSEFIATVAHHIARKMSKITGQSTI